MKKHVYIFDGLRVSSFSAIFNFWQNYSFKSVLGLQIESCMKRTGTVFQVLDTE